MIPLTDPTILWHTSEQRVDCDVSSAQTESGKLVRTLREQSNTQIVQAACWSPQGMPLVSANKDGLVTFWHPSPDDNSSQQQHHHHHSSRHTH